MTTFMLSPAEIIAHQKKEIALLQAELITKDAIIESLSRIEIVSLEERRQELPTLRLSERHGELTPTTGAGAMTTTPKMASVQDILREALNKSRDAERERQRSERLRSVRAEQEIIPIERPGVELY